MKALKKLFPVICALALLTVAPGLPAHAEADIDLTELYKKKDVTPDYDASAATVIDLGAETGPVVTITAGGDYLLSGEYAGQVVIEAPDTDKVRLILNGVTITSASGPSIWEKSADKLIITLVPGTVNTLTDQVPAVGSDGSREAAALLAQDDLSINGGGTLVVSGNAGHGIRSKADLIIADGNYSITSVKDAIRGKNSVLILEGTITAASGSDGITSTRDDKEGKGWVIIAGGTVTITAGAGAGESVRTSGKTDGRSGQGSDTEETAGSGTSVKGIKAKTDLTVLGGTVTLDAADDGLHANNITVSGGVLTIRSGDDGIHADSTLTISGGSIHIPRCREGLEGYSITISGGSITIVADDDGVSSAGGADPQAGFGNPHDSPGGRL